MIECINLCGCFVIKYIVCGTAYLNGVVNHYWLEGCEITWKIKYFHAPIKKGYVGWVISLVSIYMYKKNMYNKKAKDLL